MGWSRAPGSYRTAAALLLLPAPHASRCPASPAGGNGALAEALDAREQLAAAAAGCAAGQALAPGLDYLVGCEYNAAADQLWLLAGNNAGAVGLFPVVEPAASSSGGGGGGGGDGGGEGDGMQQDGAAPPPPAQQQQQQSRRQVQLFGQPQAVLAGGAHSDVVRSVLWPGAVGGMCLSGGEDSKLCVWSLAQQAAGQPPQQQQQGRPGGASSTGSGREQGAARKHHHSHQHHTHPHQQQRRGAPY